jgi:hypothetical protein
MITKDEAARLTTENTVDQQAVIEDNLSSSIRLASLRGEYSVVVYCPVELTSAYVETASAAGYSVDAVEGSTVLGRETDTSTLTVTWK